MKKILLAAMLLLFGISTVVLAKGEGNFLGGLWGKYNAAAATIAKKDSNGDWKYNQKMIDENGTEAKAEFQGILASLKDADDDAQAVEGKNSVDSLTRLCNRAIQAIDKGVDSFDDDNN